MINKIDLSGEWGFRLDEEKLGIDNEYFLGKCDDTIILPSTTALSGKGKPNPTREEGFLTDSYKFEGYAWYCRTADLGGIDGTKTVKLLMERTRLTTLWINGKRIGSRDSLCTPHIYDISEFAGGEINIAVLVSNTDYPTKGGHMTSPDTQSNWNGITGEISLIIGERTAISSLKAYPDPVNKTADLLIELEGTDSAGISVWGASSDGRAVDRQSFRIDGTSGRITVSLGGDAALWSEYSPVMYTLMACIEGSCDISRVTFGLRSFTSDGMDFRINGDKVHLRGKHDGMIFPLTGCAPTAVEQWLKVMGTAKSWGINHYRFHTCCPPEAAFTAADMLGIYMQPELPFWGTITAEGDENHNAQEQEYLLGEGRRILDTFGNHPSFVMMSLGNELWGSAEKMAEIISEYRSIDSRHLYTQGSNNFQFYPNILPEDDFFSGVRLSRERLIRGSYAMCDAPLGFVQTDEPNTAHSYDRLIFPEITSVENGEGSHEIEIQYGTGVRKVRVDSACGGLIPAKPIVTHEVGQYGVYPDFREIEKYTGVLKARNFEIFRERLADKGMLSLADDFFRASGRLSADCYKLEIEAAMRSEYISGFQLLDLQDFSGQGTALVGMLDAFMESKGLIDCAVWNGFCSDAVILCELEGFTAVSGESIDIPVKLRSMLPGGLYGKKIVWKALMGDTVAAEGEIPVPDGFCGLGQTGSIMLDIPKCASSARLVLKLKIDGIRPENDYLPTYTENSYTLWIYPKPCENTALCGKSEADGTQVYVTEDGSEALALLERGERVVYLPNKLRESIEGFYCTDFWCYPMFRSISESMGKPVPVGTMGLFIDNTHPALKDFDCDEYSTPQWYHIVSHADCAVLDDTPDDFRPIVQMIDNFERNHKLGILYEAKVGEGRLLVCTSRLSEISDRPEVRTFAESIQRYAHSADFSPVHELTAQELSLKIH